MRPFKKMISNFWKFLLLFCFSCHNSNPQRVASIMMDAAPIFKTKVCHVLITLDNKTIADTLVKREEIHTDFPKLIRRFEIDPSQPNSLFIIVNSKKLKFDLNRVAGPDINIHIFYDDVSRIRNKVKIADSIANDQKRNFDITKFADSLIKAVPINEQDTLYSVVEKTSR